MDKMNLLQKIIANPVLSRLYDGLVLLCIAGPFMLLYAGFVSLLWAGNYNFVQDSISSLAWTGMGWIQNIGFIITGFFMEVFAAVLALSIERERGFNIGVIILAFSGFLLVLVGAFPNNIPHFPYTILGTVHGIAANTIFVFLPIAILLIAPSLKKNLRWMSLFKYSIVTAVFALFWIALYPLCLPKDLGWFGLYERILAMTEIAWVEAMAMSLLPLSRRPVLNTPSISNIPVTSE
jgi:hypothetical membrane protein